MCLYEFWSLVSSNTSHLQQLNLKNRWGQTPLQVALKNKQQVCLTVFWVHLSWQQDTSDVWHFFHRWLWACSLCLRHVLIWKIRPLLYAMRHGRAMLDRYTFSMFACFFIFKCVLTALLHLCTHTYLLPDVADKNDTGQVKSSLLTRMLPIWGQAIRRNWIEIHNDFHNDWLRCVSQGRYWAYELAAVYVCSYLLFKIMSSCWAGKTADRKWSWCPLERPCQESCSPSFGSRGSWSSRRLSTCFEGKCWVFFSL